MKLGIGVVTFKMENRSVLNQIELKHIVLETDSLFSTSSFRGKRNESSYIVSVVDKLVQIYGLRQMKLRHSPQQILKLFWDLK
jgi:TatD DNase family protein